MKPLALVTAGPTHETIDPVRYIGNRSSGKMGFALAEALAKKGFDVKLIAGPVHLQTEHPNITRIDVQSAAEMYEATMRFALDYQLAICAAAVADFTPAHVATQKIKKQVGENDLNIRLTKTKDILKSLGEQKRPDQTLVGFSLETENAEENALGKLARKKADYIVMNTLQDKGAGFAHDTNKVVLYGKDGFRKAFALMEKKVLAEKLVASIMPSA